VVRAGLPLARLPAGFGLAAVAAERVLPAGWADRYRSTFGGILPSCSAAGLAVPLPTTVMILWLGLLGVGLGTYIPANNSSGMAAGPPPRGGRAGGGGRMC